MKIILAVSGGVDSMVMLDLCCEKYPKSDLVVAHFNHKTRASADDDYFFVQKCCRERGMRFVGGQVLQKKYKALSEESARDLRYDFFEQTRRRFNEETIIFTAHHLDDLVETIAINLMRGTGWRGLAVLSREGYARPFVDGTFGNAYSRRDILEYAAKNGIKYRFDPTNTTDDYLRNRVRKKTFNFPQPVKDELLSLRNSQLIISKEICAILNSISEMQNRKIPRRIFYGLEEEVALELLRFVINRQYSCSCTRPELLRFRDAVLTYQPNKLFNFKGNRLIRISRNFVDFGGVVR